MHLLASLCGNDIIRYEEVENFLKRIGYRCDKFAEVAHIIRGLRTEPPNLSLQDAQYLSGLIYPKGECKQGVERIYNSLNFYNIDAILKKHENSLIDEIAKSSNHCFNLIILQNCVGNLTIDLLDLNYSICARCRDLILALDRKIMGILLQHLNDKSITRIVYTKKNHNTPYEAIEIKGDYPDVTIPPLSDLLLKPFGEIIELDKLRFELVCWQISPRLTADIIRKIPEEYRIDALTIFYLYENLQITLEEADCLTLANCDEKFDLDSLKLENIKRINSRDARIVFCYSLMFINLCHCFYAVGLINIKSLIKFDGLYFHTLRDKWNKLSKDEQNETLKGVQHLRLYSKEFNLF